MIKVEPFYYDREEIIENCTVQVLTNTRTGAVSIGWWRNEPDPDENLCELEEED